MKDKRWYVDQHRKMWNWIADQIEKEQSIQDIFYLKRAFCMAIGEDPKCCCFSCQYDSEYPGEPPCKHCLFDFGGFSWAVSCEDPISVYCKCLYSETWEEQAELARKIANLPVREDA